MSSLLPCARFEQVGTTLSFRIGMVMLVGFILMQLLLLLVWQTPGLGGADANYGLPSPATLARMVEAMEQAGPAGATELADSYDGSIFTVTIGRTAPNDFREVPTALSELASRYRRALSDHNMVVDGGPAMLGAWMSDRARPMRFLVPIRLTIWMRDGRVLILTGRPSSALSAYLARRSLLGAISGALLLLMLWIALRQTTRPLRRLTRATEALGDDLRAPDATVEGSRETRALAQAFNDMKARIVSLMDERTFILAGIAHDMRTYLTRLRLRAEFITDQGQRARAERDLDQMSALLDDNLLFASIDRHNVTPMQPIDLSALTRGLVEARFEADRIAVSVNEPALIEADAAGLERIFGNLVNNGFRHADLIRIAVRHDAHTIVWQFEDNGPGVAPADLPQLGLAYHRLDPSRNPKAGGAGLGLAIVQALADAMRAQVEFGTSNDGGLRINIVFRKNVAT
ncbi:MAG: two-component sensor histidine kinase [Sphingobium sp.]|nr:two-component sensor histidine kinase [Sphingobium sp.]